MRTYWRTGRPPSTESMMCIESSAMRRPQHDGFGEVDTEALMREDERVAGEFDARRGH